MKWEGQRQSDNVQDRRSGGGGGGMIGGRGIGIGTVVLALLGGWIFGINPMTIIGVMGGMGGGAPAVVQQAPARTGPLNDELGQFVATVLASTEDVWRQQFAAAGAQYRDPQLVMYRGVTRTACGAGQAAMGPFYCPADQKVYIDLGFYQTLKNQLGAPGDSAQAYVVAHEVGHHVQNLLGISDKVDALRGRVSQAQENALSVRLELQADCLAGVWANNSQKAKGWLDQNDIADAMNAAARIGDDALQRAASGVARPESFTHGSSAQRQRWFATGLKTGSFKACDTFSAQAV